VQLGSILQTLFFLPRHEPKGELVTNLDFFFNFLDRLERLERLDFLDFLPFKHLPVTLLLRCPITQDFLHLLVDLFLMYPVLQGLCKIELLTLVGNFAIKPEGLNEKGDLALGGGVDDVLKGDLVLGGVDDGLKGDLIVGGVDGALGDEVDTGGGRNDTQSFSSSFPYHLGKQRVAFCVSEVELINLGSASPNTLNLSG